MSRGFSAIGLMRPKDVHNIGGVLRAAYCYGAAMVAIQGDRTPIRSSQDTPQAWRHLPVVRGDLHALIPFDAEPIAVDLVDDAVPLPAFQHPQRAFYVFGPEDGTLGAATLDWCSRRIMVPTRTCMNLAATVNVVLYDRMAKAERAARGIAYRDLAPIASGTMTENTPDAVKIGRETAQDLMGRESFRRQIVAQGWVFAVRMAAEVGARAMQAAMPAPAGVRVKALAEFARERIREAWNGCEEGDEILDHARKLGLIVEVPGGYDPEKHDNQWEAEPGEPWFVFAEWLNDTLEPAGAQEGAADLVPVTITNSKTGETRQAYIDRSRGVVLERDATAAEAERDALKVEVERLRKADRACQWYWPENSTESENCADSPQEVVQNAYGWEEPRGDVVAVARGGVVEVTYCAALPPAPDSDSDDEFWVEEATKEAAASKITAELERRAALSPAKAGG